MPRVLLMPTWHDMWHHISKYLNKTPYIYSLSSLTWSFLSPSPISLPRPLAMAPWRSWRPSPVWPRKLGGPACAAVDLAAHTG